MKLTVSRLNVDGHQYIGNLVGASCVSFENLEKTGTLAIECKIVDSTNIGQLLYIFWERLSPVFIEIDDDELNGILKLNGMINELRSELKTLRARVKHAPTTVIDELIPRLNKSQKQALIIKLQENE